MEYINIQFGAEFVILRYYIMKLYFVRWFKTGYGVLGFYKKLSEIESFLLAAPLICIPLTIELVYVFSKLKSYGKTFLDVGW